MHYKFIACYKIIGVTWSTGAKEQLLIEYPEIRGRSLVTDDVDGHLFELDRSSVVGFLILKGLFGEASGENFEECIAIELERVRERRKKDANQGVFVIFEAEGECEHFKPQTQRDTPDFVIAIEGISKQQIRSQYQSYISGLLASFALGSERVCGLKKVTDGVVFFNEENKPVYSYTMEMSGKAIVSTGLSGDTLDFVRSNATFLGTHQDLANVTRLLSKSLDEESDELLSFLSVWSGLEIFINKNFKQYEERAFSKLAGTGEKPTAPLRFIDRIKSVMKDKYRLVDKFSVICFDLNIDYAEEDIRKFEEINKLRNKLIHSDVPVSSLPTEETTNLLRKYLKLHAQ